MEKFKCTSPFHVILTDKQSQNNQQANIEMVNGVMGDAVREIVQRYSNQLNPHFRE
jgi:phage portal protein BeeE